MTGSIFQAESHAATHVGKVRQLNEDRSLVLPESGVFAVADGMGGHDSGDLASSAIVARLATIGIPSSAPDLQARFEDRLTRANAEIRSIAMQRRGGTIGSTVAALLVYERHFACVWAGDSRVYLSRAGKLFQVSRDHSEVQDMVDRGQLTPEEARTSPRRNVITRAIGVSEAPDLETMQGRIEPGDTFLICSDGLMAHVPDGEIGKVLAERDPAAACDALIEATLEGGAADNVTVVVVRFDEARASKPTGFSTRAPAAAVHSLQG